MRGLRSPISHAAGPLVFLCAVAFAGPSVAAAPKAAAPGFHEAFDAASVGVQPTSANTSYDQSIGDRGDGDGTIEAVIDGSGWHGKCARFYNSRVAKKSFGFLGERVGHQRTIYLRRYYKISSLPEYRMSILLYKYGGSGNGQLGGTHNGSFAIGGSGQSHKFVLVNDNTNERSSDAAVPVNAWFRVEVKIDFSSGAGIQTVRLFLGHNVNGRTPTETLSAALTGSFTDYIEDGILTNPNKRVSYRLDEVANGGGWLGPAT